MQFSHCNNGSLALTYLTNLWRPYDLELFLTKFGLWGAQFQKIWNFPVITMGKLHCELFKLFHKRKWGVITVLLLAEEKTAPWMYKYIQRCDKSIFLHYIFFGRLVHWVNIASFLYWFLPDSSSFLCNNLLIRWWPVTYDVLFPCSWRSGSSAWWCFNHR